MIAAGLRGSWYDTKIEAQQVVQCTGYALRNLGVPAKVVDLLTPLQSEFMAIALDRAKTWDSVKEELENNGVAWRLPGRCSRSLRHFVEVMSRFYPDVDQSYWAKFPLEVTSIGSKAAPMHQANGRCPTACDGPRGDEIPSTSPGHHQKPTNAALPAGQRKRTKKEQE